MERAAALVHRPGQQLPLGRLAPLVEQASCGLPLARAQLELAQVQAHQGVRGWFALFVGASELWHQHCSSLLELAAPDVALTRDPFRAGGDKGHGARCGLKASAEIVDRAPAQTACPRERVQHFPL
jgi:hypothetical protein